MSNKSFIEKLLNGAEVEWKALGDVIISLKTGLNPRQNFQLNTADAGGYYVTVREIQKGDVVFLEKTDRVNKKALGLINNRSNLEAGDILFSGTGTVGRTAVIEKKPENWNIKEGVYVIKPIHEIISSRYLSHLLNSQEIVKEYSKKIVGSPVISLPMGNLKKLQIPIPCSENPKKSLEIQAEIVRILDTFTELTTELTTELNARKKQYNYYRDQLLNFEEGEVEWKTLGDVCTSISAGGDVPKNCAKGQVQPTDEYPYPIYANATGEKGLYGYTDSYKIESEAVTISARGAKVGYHTVREAKFTPIIRLIVLVAEKRLVRTRYLNYALDMTLIGGTEGGIPQLTVPMVKKITVPIPFPDDHKKSLAEQDRILDILDKFEILTTSISEGLPREIELRQKQYEYYRDLLLSFPESYSEVAV
jgi:type I restriction enzyme, S subunit